MIYQTKAQAQSAIRCTYVPALRPHFTPVRAHRNGKPVGWIIQFADCECWWNGEEHERGDCPVHGAD